MQPFAQGSHTPANIPFPLVSLILHRTMTQMKDGHSKESDPKGEKAESTPPSPPKTDALDQGPSSFFRSFGFLFLLFAIAYRIYISEDILEDMRRATAVVMKYSGMDLAVGCTFAGVKKRGALPPASQEHSADNIFDPSIFFISESKRHVTIEELATHGPEAKRIWISLLGHVFDVTPGSGYYGLNGGYSFFSGKDGSRAFYSGEFDGGVVDDITGLDASALYSLWDWVKFYRKHKSYKFVGVLVSSRFFDAHGRPTPLLQSSLEAARNHGVQLQKARDDDWTKAFPRCNTEWSQAKGSRVWCEEGRFPRLTTLEINGKTERKCICESHSGFNMDSRRLYPNCHHEANSCSFRSLEGY